jgi:transcription elongation factor Elf1
MTCVPCGRVQSISVAAAIRLAGAGVTFGELQRRLKCANCGASLSLVVCSDSRPAATRDRDGQRPETIGR